MSMIKFWFKCLVFATIFIASLPIATISFFWTMQKNAWRFGKDYFHSFISPKGFP